MSRRSRPKGIFTKLHHLFFILLIILLPVQLGKHFWPEFAYVWGLPIDYLSPTIYLTDFLIVGLLTCWGIESLISNQKAIIKKKNNKIKLLLLLIFLFLLINSFLAQSRGIAFYKLIKLTEFFLLGYYVSRILNPLSIIKNWLTIPLVYSSLMAIGQFLKRSTLGGIFWWLGERTFTYTTPGIARITWKGELWLRPYATFPHPNVLAGFILISLVLVFFKTEKRSLFFYLSLLLGLSSLIISFSKISWLAGIMIVIHLIIIKLKNSLEKRYSWFWLCFCGLAIAGLLVWLFPEFTSLLKPGPFSLSRRWELFQSVWLMFKNQPIFGIGLGNFISQLPNFWQGNEGIRFFQPTHNLLMLVLAETGLIGLVLVLGFLYQSYRQLLKNKNTVIFYLIFIVLFTGFFDHYWLTLQQGQLLLSLILGLIWNTKKGIRLT